MGLYVGPIYGFAVRRVADRYAAEDLAQEILLQLCVSLRRGPEIRDMHAWVWRVARNTQAWWVQARTQRADQAEPWRVMVWQPSEAEGAAAERVARQEEVAGLLVALTRMSAEYRQVVVSPGRASARSRKTGLAEGTVKRRLHTARRRLRERMVGMAGATAVGRGARQPDPVWLIVYTDDKGASDQYLRRSIARSIAVATFEVPQTVEELGDELGAGGVHRGRGPRPRRPGTDGGGRGPAVPGRVQGKGHRCVHDQCPRER